MEVFRVLIRLLKLIHVLIAVDIFGFAKHNPESWL